jgi:nondiscriminating glutamyl-tRNA synthetase
MIAKREEKEIRTRYAPSPTGPFHIGGARTALFNYLFSKKNNGKFVLRIEDTDKERSKREFETQLMGNLKWMGMNWDEGPEMGGPHEPYRQSERNAIYKKYLEKLIEDGHAYHCFCSKEDVESQKQYLMSIGEAPIYNGKCRDLDKATVEKYLKEGKKSVIRFKSPFSEKIVFDDLIRGKIEVNSSTIGDFVIAKDFDNYLYNFTCVVDDVDMQINYVIRGEDHIPNTPKQILLIKAMGFDVPKYAHLSLILGADRKKMSKRDGKTSIDEYIEAGYLPEALINFIAFLGWNPGTEKEIYTMEELINDFSLDKIQKAGAIFNIDKLDWVNGLYIRKMPIKELAKKCLPYLKKDGLISEEVSSPWLEKVISLYQERLKKLSEISELIEVFFKETEYEKDLLKWKAMEEKDTIVSLEQSYELALSTDDYSKGNLEKIFLSSAEKMENRGNLLWPLRVALTGKKNSAGPMEIMEVLGKEETLKRIKKAIQKYA